MFNVQNHSDIDHFEFLTAQIQLVNFGKVIFDTIIQNIAPLIFTTIFVNMPIVLNILLSDMALAGYVLPAFGTDAGVLVSKFSGGEFLRYVAMNSLPSPNSDAYYSSSEVLSFENIESCI